MRAETQNLVQDIEKSLTLLRSRIGWDDAALRLEELNARSEDPAFWSRPAEAQRVMRERQKLADSVESYKALAARLSDNVVLIELGEAEADQEVVRESEAALAALREDTAQAEIDALLSGEADGNDAFLEIHSGAGGTESCDWALML